MLHVRRAARRDDHRIRGDREAARDVDAVCGVLRSGTKGICVVDWPNERYVRLYTRETADDLLLSWEATALWRALLLKFDRSGVLQAKRGIAGIAALVRIPLDVVERVLPELLADGRLIQIDGGYLAPNYLAAQESTKSGALRQQEYRERRRDESLPPTQLVGQPTNSNAVSHDVTGGDEELQRVTPSLPSLPKDLLSGKPDPVVLLAQAAVAEINRLAKTVYEATSKNTLEHCKALVKRGVTPEQVIATIGARRDWLADDKMRKYFRPESLLRPNKLLICLEDIKARKPKPITPTPDEPPEITGLLGEVKS